MSENTNAGGGETEIRLPLCTVTSESLLRDAYAQFGSLSADFVWGVNFALERISTALSAQSTGSGGVAAEPVAGMRAKAIAAAKWRVEDGVTSSGSALDMARFILALPVCVVAAAPTPPAGGGETEAHPICDRPELYDRGECCGRTPCGYLTLAPAAPRKGPSEEEIAKLCDRLDRLNTVSEPQACADVMDDARLMILALASPDQNRGEPDQGGANGGER